MAGIGLRALARFFGKQLGKTDPKVFGQAIERAAKDAQQMINKGFKAPGAYEPPPRASAPRIKDVSSRQEGYTPPRSRQGTAESNPMQSKSGQASRGVNVSTGQHKTYGNPKPSNPVPMPPNPRLPGNANMAYPRDTADYSVAPNRPGPLPNIPKFEQPKQTPKTSGIGLRKIGQILGKKSPAKTPSRASVIKSSDKPGGKKKQG